MLYHLCPCSSLLLHEKYLAHHSTFHISLGNTRQILEVPEFSPLHTLSTERSHFGSIVAAFMKDKIIDYYK